MYSQLDIARLKFVLTTDCNFRCDYCFEGGKSKLFLDPEDCVKLGKEVINGYTGDRLPILFFGGEPFLAYRIMNKVAPALAVYASKVGKKIQFSTITNGSILTPEILRHLKAYRYFVSVSYDLHPIAHDMHRGYNNYRKSSEMVMRTLKTLNHHTPDFCVSSVLTNRNIRYAAEGFAELIDIGVRNFAMSPVTDKTEFTPDPDEYREELLKIAEIAGRVTGRITLNPPFGNGWNGPATRRMTKSASSVNIELNPINGLNIVPESMESIIIDYGSGEKINTKQAASRELLLRISEAEEVARERFIELRKESGC
jgi:sulfatase maturation enzyme AslB (radical SAM superfamily)